MRTTGLIVALVVSAPAVAGAEEDEAIQDAVAVLESDAFLGGLGTCFGQKKEPAEITLTVKVSDAGKAEMTQCEPMLLAATSSCIASVVASLSFPQTVWGIEITFAVPVTDLPGPAQPGPSPAPVQPAPVPAPVIYGVQPVYYQPQPYQPHEDWKVLHESGRRKLVAGAVLTGIGSAMLLGGIAAIVIIDSRQSDDPSDPSTGAEGVIYAPLALMVIAGLGMTIPGVILIGVGKRRMRQADRLRGQLQGLAPLPSIAPLRGGGALTLTWRF
jgi:hypothetical protein